jgi:serine/threonine-protein kinase
MFRRAVELDPGFALAHARLSIVYSNRYRLGYDRTEQMLNDAQQEADRAIILDPSSGWGDVAIGYYHYAKGEYAPSIAALEKASARLTGEPWVFRGLGAVRRRSGQVRESLSDWNRALDVDLRSPDLYREIASTHTLIREYPAAIRYFDESISLGPDQLGVYWEKARAQTLSSGSTVDAERTLTAMPQIGDPAMLAWANIQIPLLARKYQAVIAYLENTAPDVISNQERFLPKDLALAGVYALAGDAAQARSNFERAVARLERERDRRPSDGRVHAALAIAYAGVGRKVEAVREAQNGASLAGPTTDAMTGPVRLYDLARVYVAIGDFGPAIAALDEVLSIPSFYSAEWVGLDPDFDRLRTHSGYASLLQKRPTR